MLEHIVLGLVQGVVEWLPISSEGAVIATKNIFFPGGESFGELIRLALFLHLGTFFAALIYFRKEVGKLLARLFRPQEDDETRKVLIFLLIATFISGILGFAVLQVVEEFEEIFTAGSKVVNLLIAAMLFVTAFLQFKSKKDGGRKENELVPKDGIILGLVQGVAVIPGLSRSGLTVSTLLLRKFDDVSALTLSFLMSLPIVLAGNIVLNFSMFTDELSKASIAALLASFLAGIITIDILLRLARRVNFAWFTFAFGILLGISVFI